MCKLEVIILGKRKNTGYTSVVPTSGRDPNQGRGVGGSDVGSREGFMDNSIIMKKSKFVSKFKQNDRENVITESFKHSGAIIF